MAKITARGDSARARYRHPDTGAELLLTTQGRLLRKAKGGKFTLDVACSPNGLGNLSGYQDRGFEKAKEIAKAEGMERV